MTEQEAIEIIMKARGYEFKPLLELATVCVWINTKTGDWDFQGDTEAQCHDLNVLAEICKGKGLVIELYIDEKAAKVSGKPLEPGIIYGGDTIQEAAMFATAEALKKAGDRAFEPRFS